MKCLLKYLNVKEESGAVDGPYAYARASLPTYAKGRLEHERSSLSKAPFARPVEFENETSPAQDLRRSEVMHQAAADFKGPERFAHQRWADGNFQRALLELVASERSDRCRPLILLMRPLMAVAFARGEWFTPVGLEADLLRTLSRGRDEGVEASEGGTQRAHGGGRR